MNRRRSLTVAIVAAALCSPAFAQDADQPHQHGMPPMDPKMAEMMQACMEAGTPGEMHAFLAKSAGVWEGTTTMWMMPDAEPMKSTGTMTMTPVFEGRYLKCDMVGEMPGMGQFRGSGYYAFDNTTQQFQSTWIDNMSTGIMNGTGELSSDKKTLTWTFTFNCPVEKKPKQMREVVRYVDANTTKIEMFGPDLEGKEYKMMEMNLKRKSDAATASRPARPASTTAAPDR